MKTTEEVTTTTNKTLTELGEETLMRATLPKTPGELALSSVHWVPENVPFGPILDPLIRRVVQFADILPDNGHEDFPGGFPDKPGRYDD